MNAAPMNAALKVAVIFIIIIFYGSLALASPPNNNNLITVKVGHLPIADCGQLFVGIDKGYFNNEGLELKLVTLANGPKLLEALAAKDIDIGYASVVPLILAKSRGIDLLALTGGPSEDAEHTEHAMVVRNDSAAISVLDLANKTISIATIRSIDELIIKEWLSRNGVDVTSVSFREVPFPQMHTAVVSGSVDAAGLIEPFVTVARQSGKSRELANHYLAVAPVIPMGSYDARGAWVRENPGVVVRFQNAIRRATEYATVHPDETKTIITKFTNINPTIASAMTLPRFDADLSPKLLDSVIDLMVKWRFLETEILAKTVIYNGATHGQQ